MLSLLFYLDGRFLRIRFLVFICVVFLVFSYNRGCFGSLERKVVRVEGLWDIKVEDRMFVFKVFKV